MTSDLSFAARVPSGQVEGAVGASITWWGEPGCFRDFLGSKFSHDAAETDGFERVAVLDQTAPAGASHARITTRLSKENAGGVFEAWVDDV